MIGMSGLPGPSAYIIARHSQSDRMPACPRGGVKLWDGYSLLKTEYAEGVRSQDLGENERVYYHYYRYNICVRIFPS